MPRASGCSGCHGDIGSRRRLAIHRGITLTGILTATQGRLLKLRHCRVGSALQNPLLIHGVSGSCDTVSLLGRRVSKRYRALLCGRLEGDGWVDFPLEGGRVPALTRYAAVHHSPNADDWLTTVDLWPHTGEAAATARTSFVMLRNLQVLEDNSS